MVFEASFPLADAAQLAELPDEAAERRLTHVVSGRRFVPTVDEAEREGTLVLVVDDHPTNRLVLSRQVAALGYAVLTADDGAQGLALWQSRRIGLVLTDCNMPGLSGYDLARAIRRAETGAGAQRVPIVACTANAMGSEAARCLAAGMDDCMVKPVDLIELMERLDHWIPVPTTDFPALAEPAEAEGQASGVFDPWLLDMICNGDPEAERSLLIDFQRTNDRDLEQLLHAVGQGEHEQVKRLAHRIKGAAQTLGAGALLAACRALEQRVADAAPAHWHEPVAQLHAEVQRLYAAIATRMGRAPCSGGTEPARPARYCLPATFSPGATQAPPVKVHLPSARCTHLCWRYSRPGLVSTHSPCFQA
jgi:CheY-like chemotaxis protein